MMLDEFENEPGENTNNAFDVLLICSSLLIQPLGYPDGFLVMCATHVWEIVCFNPGHIIAVLTCMLQADS